MFKYEKQNVSKTVKLTPVERVVEFTPSGVDAENIVKILSLSVDGRVMNATAADGYVEVEGRANFKLIYIDRDSVARGVDYNADFSVRLEGDVSVGDSVSAAVSVQEADAKAALTLTLSAIISVSAEVVKREEEEILVDAEECYKTSHNISLPAFIAAKTAVIPVEDEAEVGEVGSVLSLDSATVIRSAVAGKDIVTVGFAVYATVVYTEGGELKTARFELEESEEISVEGTEEGDVVYAAAALNGGRVVLAGVTGANILRYESDVSVRLQVFRVREIEVVKDMFMLTNEVTLEEKECGCAYPTGMDFYSEKVSGSIDLEGAGDVIAIPASRAYVAKAEVTEDGTALVEGLITADVVYTDENGLNSVRAEVPFSIIVGEGYSGEIAATAAVQKLTAKSKRNGFDIEVILGVSIVGYTAVEVGFVAGVTVGEEKEVNTSGLSLYITAEGDEMWDVCKALTATPEALLLQNPTLVAPFSEGEKVVYFRSLEL